MMEIQRILRKLEPLLPRQVVRWRRTLDVAESDMIALVERQIRFKAHEYLGDYSQKLLLSLPAEKRAQGEFHLGKILYDKPKWDCGVSRTELTQHLSILGRSGAGKTNVALHMMQQLVEKKIPFLVLDWKRTYRDLIPFLENRLDIYTPSRSLNPFPFNPFIVPPGVERNVYLNHLIDVMGTAYTLGDGAKSILQKTFSAAYKKTEIPTIDLILECASEIQTKERATGWKISTIRALESIDFSQTMILDKKEQQDFAMSLMKQNTVVELDALSHNSKKFLVPLLCYWLYAVRLGSQDREKLKFVIFLEEAHHTVYRQEHRAKESLMNVLIRQCRELGIGFIVIDQHPHLLSSAALGNCFTKICLNLSDPTDMNKAAGLLLLDDSEKRFLSMLPVGQGIVKLQDRIFRPFLVQFPLMPVQKGKVTDGLLKRYLSGEKGVIGGGTHQNRQGDHTEKEDVFLDEGRMSRNKHGGSGTRDLGIPVDTPRVLFADKIEKDGLSLLHDVISHPSDSVRSRYKRLGFGMSKGSRLKNQLVESGLLHEESVKIGSAHLTLLRPTDVAKNILVPKDGRDGRAGFEHEYWKGWYSDKLASSGFQPMMEVPRRNSSGRMDLIAAGFKQPNICVEIETGKSDVVSNVKHDLLDGYKKIIVVASDERALARVTRQLDEAGLLLPKRVIVVLRDQLDDAVIG